MATSSANIKWTFEESDVHSEEMEPFRIKRKENNEIRKDSLEILKVLLLEEENLNACQDEEFLLRFLRCTKFDCWKALLRMKKYYKARGLHPEIFGEYYPSSTERAQTLKHLFASPYRTEDGACLLVFKLGRLDPEVASLEEFLRLDLLIMETLAKNPVTQVCGCKIIVDFSGLTQEKMSQLTPRRRRTVGDIFEHAFSLPVKKIHVVNSPGLIFSLYGVLIPVMTKKQKKTVKVYSVEEGWEESLHSEVPAELLPTEYGGHIDTSDMIDLCKVLEGREEDFRNLQQYCMLDLSKGDEEQF